MSKILLITGGASGIGASTARFASDAGWDIAINYRTRSDKAQALVEEIRAKGRRAVALRADISVPQDVEALFAAVDAQLGRLDALVNSAGIGTGPIAVRDADPSTLERMFRTNVFGTILASKEAVKRLSTLSGGKGGTIVNVSSMAATIGGRPGSSLYAASKAAVDSFTEGLAKEVAREGIRAVSVRPGFTDTEMTVTYAKDPGKVSAIASTIPFGRIGRVEEISRPIVWLLSDEASFISGAKIDLSGGGFLLGSAPIPTDR
jgi:NAD(P)-dependent dehydrogenase (short-subunit alcohol dehydrogenase family)